MNAIIRNNRRAVGWLLTLALIFMASASGASWQCLDGRPCPPGCSMQHAAVSAHPACCQTGQKHCPLCPAGPRLRLPAPTAGCSSSQCVLRIQSRPDALTQSISLIAVDSPAVLPALVAQPIAVETTAPAFSLPFLPPRDGGTAPHAPRAPPTLL